MNLVYLDLPDRSGDWTDITKSLPKIGNIIGDRQFFGIVYKS